MSQRARRHRSRPSASTFPSSTACGSSHSCWFISSTAACPGSANGAARSASRATRRLSRQRRIRRPALLHLERLPDHDAVAARRSTLWPHRARAFWIRRILRIWPLYYLIVLIGFFVLAASRATTSGLGLPATMLKTHLLPFVALPGQLVDGADRADPVMTGSASSGASVSRSSST